VLCRASRAHDKVCKTHGKGHTVAFCTVNSLCRASSSITHGEQTLPCVTCGARQTKVTDGTAGVTASKGLCRAAGMGRTAKNDTFSVRLTLSRTTIKTKNKKIQHAGTTGRGSPHCAWDAGRWATTASPVLAARRQLEWREREGGGDSLHASLLPPSVVGGRRGRRARRAPPGSLRAPTR
jgi:hypothetical protein